MSPVRRGNFRNLTRSEALERAGYRKETVNVSPQTLLADGANLVGGYLGVLFRATHLQAAPPARMRSGGEGADDHSFGVPCSSHRD